MHVRVSGHTTLDRSVKESLLADEAFAPLSNSLKVRLAGDVNPGAGWLSVQVQDTAVFIAEDWVISIHGARLLHCISAMCVVISVIGQQLDALVSIVLLNPLNKDDNRLYSLLNSERSRNRIRGGLFWVFTILTSGIVGALIGFSIQVLAGDG